MGACGFRAAACVRGAYGWGAACQLRWLLYPTTITHDSSGLMRVTHLRSWFWSSASSASWALDAHSSSSRELMRSS